MQSEEVTVSIKDVLIYCFLHWRSAIIVVLAGAIIGGAYYVYKSQVYITSNAVQTAEEATNYSESVRYSLDVQKENILLLSDYLEQSLLMRIDPNNEYVSQATIVIFVDELSDSNNTPACMLGMAYTNALLASPEIIELANSWNTTAAFVRELLSISVNKQKNHVDIGPASFNSGNSNIVYIQNSDQIEATLEADNSNIVLLTIIAKGSTADEASAVRDAVLSYVDEVQKQLTVSIAPHNYRIVETSNYISTDYALLQQQVDRANAVSIASTALTSNTRNAPSAGTATTIEGSYSPKTLLKGGIVGGIAAFLFYGFILCLRYVHDASPVMRGQIEARYALPEVGSYIYGWEGFYRGVTGFDRWLRKLAGLEDKPDAARVAEMVAANVRLYAGDVQTLLVSSSVESGKAFELSEALTIQLEDMHIVLANDLANSVDARSQLKVADAVLFVEEYGKSVYESIDAEITLAAETGKMPLGLVMA